MNRFIKTAMAVMLAVIAMACTRYEELPIQKNRGAIDVLINGIINGYAPQDATRAVAQNVVRIMWQGGETVYVYEGAEYLGNITASKGDDAGTYATLSGTIGTPTSGKTLTLVYSPQFSGAPTVSGSKLSLDLSTQATNEVPFLIYATMPATEAIAINGASVHFDLATSIYKCNCSGLVAEGSITKAVIGNVNTVCELTLSDNNAPTVSGTTPGNITRKAGFSAVDQRAIFSIAVAKTGAATARTIEITKDGKRFGFAFDKGALGTAAAYNTVCVMQFASSMAKATINDNDVYVPWVQLWAGGPKFAVYNVGATQVTDYGGYYTWGGKNNGTGSTWIDDHTPGVSSLFGGTDTATQLWGSNWRMLGNDEFVTLSNNCVGEWTNNYNNSGKKGWLFTGKGEYASNSLFLPAAGYVNTNQNNKLFSKDSGGYYWSSTPDGNYEPSASSTTFSSNGLSNGVHVDRKNSRSVRAVLIEPATKGTAQRNGDTDGSKVDVDWVQLWEDGPKFAVYNVGATSVTDYGGYYAWGGSTDKVEDHNTGKSALSGESDTATKLWGNNWRMPTKEEFNALYNNCDRKWTNNSGKNGWTFTGKGDYAPNSIFLPAAGYYYNSNTGDVNNYGHYWSSTPDDTNANNAFRICFKSNSYETQSYKRNINFTVRAVLAE